MSLSFDTGNTEDRACLDCGVTVRHVEHVTSTSKGPVTWASPVKHEAPCGLLCLGGGVHPRDYRAGKVHSMATGDGKVRSCVKCGVWERK